MFAFWIVKAFIPVSMDFFSETVLALRIFSIVFLMMGHVVMTCGVLTAIERSRQAFALSLLRGIFMVSVSLYVCTYFLQEKGLWISCVVSELSVLLIAIYYLFQNKKWI